MTATAPAGFPQQIQQGVQQMPRNNISVGATPVVGRPQPQGMGQYGYGQLAQPAQQLQRQPQGGFGTMSGGVPQPVRIGSVGPKHHHHHHERRRHHHHHHHRSNVSVPINSPGSNSGGYHFTLPTNQSFDLSPGNLHLPSSTTGYTITYSQQG